jgi:molybdate transport system substrate-binding protein
MRRILIVSFLTLFLIQYAQGKKESVHKGSQTLRVAVAANAQFAAEALKNNFEKKHPAKIELIVSSSGKLTAQIMQGAPYDIFLSADMKYPERLHKKDKALNKPKVYAYGKLVLWTMENIHWKNGIKVLKNNSFKTISIANLKTAPYGVASIEALKNAGIYKAVKSKIVFGESIAQVDQYILSGVADVAFTAESVVESPTLKHKGNWIEVPGDIYQPIKQGAVILQHAKKNNYKAAKAFYKFLFSKKGRAILKKFGYNIK